MGKRDALVVEEGMKWVKNQKPCGNHKNNKERRNRLIVRRFAKNKIYLNNDPIQVKNHCCFWYAKMFLENH